MDVLIVDDSPVMRKLLRRGLRQAGFDHLRVIEAHDGAEAIDLLDSKRFDVVSTGWHMPNVTGIELLRHIELNELDLTAGVVTAHATRSARRSAAEAGARFFIPKPFTPDTLRDGLATVLA